MLPRVLEPETMDTCEEAMTYNAMDHDAVNERFVDDLLAAGPIGSDILDLGTGTALIPVALCRKTTETRIMAADAAAWMLEIARYNLEVHQCTDRIQLHLADAKKLIFQTNFFDCVMSNTLVHHLPNPISFFVEATRVVRPNGVLFVRDLFRPESDEEVERLVGLYGGSDAKGQQLLRQSFHAALTVDEIRGIVEEVGIQPECVRMTSDRHWTLAARADENKQVFAPMQ